jgi:alpha-tubulin suppressor-like RCC1 family protein
MNGPLNDFDALALRVGVPTAIGRYPRGGPPRPSRRRSRPRGRPLPTALAILAVFAGVALVLAADTSPASGQPAPEAGAPALSGLTAVATGSAHGCAVTTTHQVRCWGDDTVGQLGDGGAEAGAHRAVTVRAGAGTGPLTGVTSLALGDFHSCAVTRGEVRCWGANGSGQLGDGTDTPRRRPVAVKDPAGTGRLRDVVQVTASYNTTCARLRNGQVRCWGTGLRGQLGNGTESERQLPVVVRSVAGPGALTGVAQVEAGSYHVCARLTSGEARCWGENAGGQLGNDDDVRRSRPVVVRNGSNTGPLTGVRRISAGGSSTCVARTDGTARCWGSNQYAQLGDGTADPARVPVPVVTTDRFPLRNVASVDAAALHGCALLTTGRVRCWGANVFDQLGNGTENPSPAYVAAPVRNVAGTGELTGVTQMNANAINTCVRLANGQARCWGYGGDGALGDGGTANRPLPRVVTVAVN